MHGQPIAILKEKYHSFPISFCGQVSPPLSMPSYAQLTPGGGIMEKPLENSHVVLMEVSLIICFKIWFDFLSGEGTSVWLDGRQTGPSIRCSFGLLLASKRLKVKSWPPCWPLTLYCASHRDENRSYSIFWLWLTRNGYLLWYWGENSEPTSRLKGDEFHNLCEKSAIGTGGDTGSIALPP